MAEACSKLDLAHGFQAFNTCYKETGLWGVYFVCDPLKIDVSYKIAQQLSPQ